MYDWRATFNVTKVLAAVFGVMGFGLVMVNLLWVGRPALGDLGLVCIATGAVLRIRSWFAHGCERERNAFLLGRDYERRGDNVRELR